jgi:hypothetical protein
MKTTLIILVSLSVAYVGLRLAGAWRNQCGVDRAVEELRREAPAHSATVSHAALDGVSLPAIARAYLKRSLPDGARIPRLASLVQRGGFRLKAGAPFMDMRANQLFSVQAPGLVWQANMRMLPGLPVLVRDAFVGGRGEFGGRVFGLFTVASGIGPEVDVATLIRYLSEAIWFPYALLPSEWLHWEALDNRSARAILTDRGRSVTGVYTFDAEGRPVAFDAERPRDVEGKPVRTPWHVAIERYSRMAGVEIPVLGSVSWMLPEGPLEYGRFEIVNLKFED